MNGPALKRDLYENCRVKNINGDVIFFCSSKRAHWYLDRNLAIIVSKDPLEIQLNFKAKGDGHLNDAFYLQHRENICVVCGRDDNRYLNRHHVVPYNFRRYLPDSIKNNDYHDILLLCLPCHETYETHALILKKQLAEEYSAPVDGMWLTNKEAHKSKYQAKMIARTLLEHYDKIPQERKELLISRIREALNLDTNDINLKEVASLNLDPPEVRPQGEIVVSKLTDIEAFLQRWRQHFVDVMKPQHLPRHWNVMRSSR
jgi:hypothetical protein